MRIALNGGEPVRKTFLPFHKVNIGAEEIEEVNHTLLSGWLTTGPKVIEFQKKFSEYIGIKHSVALNSCTAALHLALEAIGINPGDEVITSPYTFAATANVIEHMGGKVIFADIDKETMNISPEKIKEKISSKTKAVIPVHFAGLSCEMDKIMEIAKNNGIYVISDAAHAVEADFNGIKIGKIADITCFSFYSTKNLCCGEGGMITTENDEFAERIKLMSLHGISRDAWNRYTKEGSWYYQITSCGYKYNMSDIQAAIGIHQLNKLEKNWHKRKKIAQKYNALFKTLDEVQTPEELPDSRHSWHLYPLRIDFSKLQTDRKEFIEALKAENIGTSVHFIPLHLHHYYKNKFSFSPQDFVNAYSEYKKEVSLPLFPEMTENDINDVCLAVEKLIKYYKKKISEIKKINNQELNLRNIKALEYFREKPILNKLKTYMHEKDFIQIIDDMEAKCMQIVLKTLSIYYEDEAIELIKNEINDEVEKLNADIELN